MPLVMENDELSRSLAALPEQYATGNWNGYDEKPLNRDSHRHAKAFAENLPKAFRNADVGIDADGEVTVSAHESLRVGIHWDEGARVNPSRSLLGAADISDGDVKSAGLAVRPAPLAAMSHHAELTGWPQGDDEDAKLQRIDIATDLADASVYVAKE